jgi:hypothetical protein
MDFQDVSPQLEKLASEFNYKDPPDFLVRLQELISYVLRAIADFLKQFKISIPGTDTSAVGNIMQIVLVILGAICLFITLFLMFRRMKHLQEQAQLAKRGALSLEEILDSAGWKQKAEELAKARLFKDACRAVYLSVIYLLDEKQVLNFAPTRTNYEYYYALSGKESLQRGFRRLSDLVEVMWFGNYIAEENDFNDCMQLSETIERDVTQWIPKAETIA